MNNFFDQFDDKFDQDTEIVGTDIRQHRRDIGAIKSYVPADERSSLGQIEEETPFDQRTFDEISAGFSFNNSQRQYNEFLESQKKQQEIEAKRVEGLDTGVTARLGHAIGRGTLGAFGTAGAFAKTVGGSIGNKEISDFVKFFGQNLQDYSKEELEEFNRHNPLTTASRLEEIRSGNFINDTANVIINQFGENLPNLGIAAAGGAAGGMAGGLYGAYAGAFTGSFALNAGDVRQELEANGVKDEATLQSYTYLTGAVVAALDSFSVGGLFSDLAGSQKRQISKYIALRILAGAQSGALREAVTEAIQEGLQATSVAHAAGKDLDLNKLLWRMGNAAFAGGLLGGTFGGAGGSFQQPTQMQQGTVDVMAAVNEQQGGTQEQATTEGTEQSKPENPSDIVKEGVDKAIQERIQPVEDAVREVAKTVGIEIPEDTIQEQQQGQETTESETTENKFTNSLQRNASWVIQNKETGEVLFETFDPAKVEALNTEKYVATPIQEYLGSLNNKDAQQTEIQIQDIEARQEEVVAKLEQISKLPPLEALNEILTLFSPSTRTSLKKATQGLSEKQAKQLVEKVKRAITREIRQEGQTAKVSQNKTSRKTQQAQNSDPKVTEYLNRLEESASDSSAFSSVLEELIKPRTINKQQAIDIANQYIGIDQKFKTKKAAIQAIQEAFQRGVDTARRLGMTDQAFLEEGSVVDKLAEAISSEILQQQESDLAFLATQTGRLADDQIRTAKAGLEGPTQNLIELVQSFNETLGITLREGHVKPGARGQASRITGVVRQKVFNDFDTLAHEGGHVLENRYGAELEAVKQSYSNELIPLASPGEPLSEGFAEFFRRYVTNPIAAQNAAPGFFDAFETFLESRNPEILQSLQEIQVAFQEWIDAPSAGVIAKDLSTTKKENKLSQAVSAIKDSPLGAMGYAFNKMYTGVIDDLHPVRIAVDRLLGIASHNLNVDKNDLYLKASDDAYKIMRLSRDAYSSGHMDIIHGVRPAFGIEPEGPSLRDAMATAFGGTDKSQWNEDAYAYFGGYLVSRRMRQEWARFKAGEISNPPDKFSLADHEQNIAELEKNFPQFVDAANMVYQWTQNLLKKKHEAGFLTDEQYLEFSGMVDYTPALRDQSEKTTLGRDSKVTASRKVQKGKLIKQFKGSQRAVINPIESLAKDAYELSGIIFRNEAVKALHKTALAAGPDGGSIAEQIPDKQLKMITVDPIEALKAAAKDAGMDPRDVDMMVTSVSDQLGQDQTANLWRMGEMAENGEPILYYWENGKRVAVRLSDGEFGVDVYNALTGLGKENAGLIVNALALPATWLRIGVTSSLDFIGANFLRDQLATWILTEDFTPFVSGIKGTYSEITQADLVRNMNAFGVLMGGANTSTLDSSRIKRDVLSLRQRNITLRELTLRDLTRLTEFTETGTRAGVFSNAFQRAKDTGLTDYEAAIEAAFSARDFIDFGKHGSHTMILRKLIPFFNAALQGMDRAARTIGGFANNPMAIRQLISPYVKSRTGQVLNVQEKKALPLSTKMWAKMVGIGFIGLSIAMLYEDDEEYEEISDYIKATHWVFKAGDGTWVRIPKPFELAFFSNMFERTYDYAWKNDPTAPKRFLHGLGHILIPPLDPTVNIFNELRMNYNTFRGRAIVPEYMKGLPPHLQFNQYSSTFSKFLGKQVGVSPAMIDHAVKGIGGSIGREFLTISNQFANEAPETDAVDYFFVRRFLWKTERGSTSSRKFWESAGRSGGKFSQSAQGYKQYINQGLTLEASEFINGLDPDKKAYAILEGHFKSNLKRLHPLNRARDVVGVANGIRKQINLDRLVNERSEKPIELTPSQKHNAIQILSDIQNREMRNALVLMGVEGWAQKKMMPVEPVLEELKKELPTVYKEYLQRQKTKTGKAKVYPFDRVRKAWPKMKKRLLEDGEKAQLYGL